MWKKKEGILNYFQEDFQSCYVLNEGKIYNLLLMNNDNAYNKWVYATEQMNKKLEEDLTFKEKIKDKEYRVACFEYFKGEYKE